MAGSEDPRDNPVAINVVPLVDIIFCLCVFFMCSFKFRQIEGRFDTWLPKGDGIRGTDSTVYVPPSEIRVAILYDEASGAVTRRFGSRVIADDADLEQALGAASEAWRQKGNPAAPLTIDADPRVPWNEVTVVVNLAKRLGIANVEFAMGKPPAARGRGR
jgi:biopolymer transport protein ExbD